MSAVGSLPGAAGSPPSLRETVPSENPFSECPRTPAVTKFFLTLHVLAAILAVGPVTVAASMFPPALRRAQADPRDGAAVASLRLLQRICSVYAFVGVAVPVTGFVTAGSLGVLGSAWLIASIIITMAAAVVLIVLVLPRQEAALAAVSGEGEGGTGDTGGQQGGGAGAVAVGEHTGAQLAMYTGIFNLLWVTVTVLMIIRPGSTTGA
ncbi:membrane protein [Streptomyces longisporoflavus]|nr:membrane protein [Streptomyces longisporoflavus]